MQQHRLAPSRGFVTFVNPNSVRPAVTPYALEILGSHLEVAGFDVDVLDLTFGDRHWGVEEYFRRERAAPDRRDVAQRRQHPAPRATGVLRLAARLAALEGDVLDCRAVAACLVLVVGAGAAGGHERTHADEGHPAPAQLR
jgi:hypothetical protein